MSADFPVNSAISPNASPAPRSFSFCARAPLACVTSTLPLMMTKKATACSPCGIPSAGAGGAGRTGARSG